jgi:peptidoglycan/LPS O-acetylase OafA/YrhL
LLAALVVFTAIRLAYVAALQPGFHAVVRKTAGLRLDSLMYGVVAAWLNRHAHEAFVRGRWLTLALGAAVVVGSVRAVVVLAPSSPLGASAAVAGVSLGAALTLPFLSTWQVGPGPIRAVFEWSSRISYALYLCHLPTSNVIRRLGVQPGPLGLAIFVVVSCALATLVYYAFERPFLTLRDRLPRHTPAPATIAESLPA